MNPSFFGLEAHPFSEATEVDEPFVTGAHESLIAELHAGLKAPHGITLLIGDEGAGKSTLAKAFSAELAESATVAYLPTTGPGLRHLLTEIIEQLGGSESTAAEEQALLDELNKLARARAEHGRTTLIVLDNAHELPAKTIERLGKLFGDDPADPSMLHILLVGRGELLDRMNAANDRSILKHLVQVCRMDPIGPEDAFRYIADRISKVGGVVDSLFTEDALHMIVKRANGYPARIDAICSASLERAETRGASNVDTQAVDQACAGGNGGGFNTDFEGSATAQAAPSSYFLSDEAEQEAAVADMDMEPATDLDDELEEGEGGRSRLVIWAVGLIAVVGAFAFTMTGGGDNVQVAQNTAPKPPARTAAVDDGGAKLGEPAAVPKLTAKREADGGRAGQGTDARPGGKKKRQIAQEQAGGEGDAPAVQKASAPVHAAPSGPAGVEQAAAAAAGKAAAAAGGAAAAVASTADSAEAAATGAANDAQAAAKSARNDVKDRAAAIRRDAAAQAGAAKAAGREAAQRGRPPARPARVDPATAPARPAKDATKMAAAKPEPRPRTSTVLAPRPKQPRVDPTQRPSGPAPAAPRPAAQRPKAAPQNAAPPKKPAAAPTKVAAMQPKPAALPRSYYTVQIGAFSSKPNAEALLAKVRAQYADGRIITVDASGKQVFRVVSGTFTDMGAAKGRAQALTSSGFSTYVRSVGK